MVSQGQGGIPDSQRVIARQVSLTRSGKKGASLSVTIAEQDRADPRVMYLGVNLVSRLSNGGRGDSCELAGSGTVDELDELIEAFTVARDTALVNFMIEPAGV